MSPHRVHPRGRNFTEFIYYKKKKLPLALTMNVYYEPNILVISIKLLEATRALFCSPVVGRGPIILFEMNSAWSEKIKSAFNVRLSIVSKVLNDVLYIVVSVTAMALPTSYVLNSVPKVTRESCPQPRRRTIFYYKGARYLT